MAYTTINKSSLHMNTKLYTGNSSTQSITGVGFQPDLTWIKQRGGTTNHVLYDAVRGAYWTIQSNTNSTQSADDGLTGWNSDGFNIGNVATTNLNTSTYAGWNWKAGTSVSGNTSGSGTSKTYTGSVNTDSGFSIIRYFGNGTLGHTIPHHLGVAPSMMIIKITDGDTSDWYVYHKDLGNTGILFLSNTNASSNSNAYWNSTTPTSSVFTVGDQTGNNSNNNTFVAYCFADVQGYSKFGSYIGNGNADGTFVYTGFKPAFVMRKDTSATNEWTLIDSKRSTYNQTNQTLVPNASDAEDGDFDIDILSNGFKCRTAESAHNGSGRTYIYMAFAEAPLVGDNNVPCTAR